MTDRSRYTLGTQWADKEMLAGRSHAVGEDRVERQPAVTAADAAQPAKAGAAIPGLDSELLAQHLASLPRILQEMNLPLSPEAVTRIVNAVTGKAHVRRHG